MPKESAASEQVRRQVVELLPRLRRFARAIARNVHDADDLVQLSIERALLKFDQWRPEQKFDGWMFGIMRNAWIDEVRSRSRRDRVFAPEEAGVGIGHDGTESQVRLLAVQSAVAESAGGTATRGRAGAGRGSPTRKPRTCSKCRSAR